jgi:hypothetical protein
MTTGDALQPEDFDTAYNDVIGSFATNPSNANAAEVVVPQYVIESRGVSIISDGILYDSLVSYDVLSFYVFAAIAPENSPSQMPTLISIADQALDPARPNYTTEAMQTMVDGFAAEVGGRYLPLLNRLPNSSEIPAEYQLIDEEVVIF